MQDEVKFHSDRALIEIDRARRAADHIAAEAHLRLSELHVQRVRELARPLAATR